MSVDIKVDLELDKKDVAAIKSQLETLDEDLDLDINLDDVLDGDFSDVKLDLDDDHLKKQIRGAFDDIEADFDVPASGDVGQSDSPPDVVAKQDSIQRTQLGKIIRTLGQIRRLLATQTGNINPEDLAIKDPFGSGDGDDVSLGRWEGKFSDNDFKYPSADDLTENLRATLDSDENLNYPRPSTDLRKEVDLNTPRLDKTDGSFTDFLGVERTTFGMKRKSMQMRKHMYRLDDAMGVVGRTMNRLRPTIGQIYSIVALLVPVMIGVASAAGAAAVALGGLAVAGLAIGVLGALGGEADTLSGSLKNLETQMQDFKSELFQAIQPAADTLAPLFESFMDIIVHQVARLNDELAAFGQFGAIFQRGIRGAGAMVEELFSHINNLAPILTQLGDRVGSFIKNNLPGFLRKAAIEASENQDVLADVLHVFWDLLRVVYQLSIFILNLISALRPFGSIISWIANLLDNRFIKSILVIISAGAAMIATVVIISKVLASLIAVIFALNGQLAIQGSLLSALKTMWGGTWIASAIKGIQGLITQVLALNGVLGVAASLATALAAALTLGIGGAIAIGTVKKLQSTLSPETPSIGGGGSSGPSAFGSSRSGGDDVTMNFYGDMDNQSRQRIVDVTKEQQGSQDLQQGRFGTMQ